MSEKNTLPGAKKISIAIPQFFQLVTFYCVNLSFGCRVIRALQSCPGAETIFPSSVLLQCDRINKKTLLYRILCREIFWGLFRVFVHQQNGYIVQNVDSEGQRGSNPRNTRLYGQTATPTTTTWLTVDSGPEILRIAFLGAPETTNRVARPVSIRLTLLDIKWVWLWDLRILQYKFSNLSNTSAIQVFSSIFQYLT